MSKRTWSICIEGIPWVLGNIKPSWHDGTLVSDCGEMPRIYQSIDLMGGVARFDDVEIRILDTLVRWAPLFRPVQPTSWRVLSPNPIEYNTTTGINLESATGLMEHKDIRLLTVTGGAAVVRAAMRSGKRAVCAGPGNPPVVVDETADLAQAGRDIVIGGSFSALFSFVTVWQPRQCSCAKHKRRQF